MCTHAYYQNRSKYPGHNTDNNSFHSLTLMSTYIHSNTHTSHTYVRQVKETLRQCVTYPLKYPRLYREGVAAEAVKGVLLFGPPGKRIK